MDIKSIDTLSITECCEQLNIRREDLHETLQNLRGTDGDKLLIVQLESLLNKDKSAIESCKTIEQYEEYLSTWDDGLYHGYALERIAQLKAEVRKRRFKFYFVILLLIFFAINLLSIAIETIGLTDEMHIHIYDEDKRYGSVFVDDIFGNKYPLLHYSPNKEGCDTYGWVGLGTTIIYNPNIELSESYMITIGNSIIHKRKVVSFIYSMILILLSFLVYTKFIQKKHC